MEATIMKELASHGSVSWLLERGLFILGFAMLMHAHVQTDNPILMLGIIAVLFAEIIEGARTGPDPDGPRPSWWPWKRSG